MDELLMFLADEMFHFAQLLEARAMELEQTPGMIHVARGVRDVSIQVDNKATEIQNLVVLSD